MTELIPDEDNIQKTQLWQRTIDAIRVAQGIKEELYPQVLQTRSNTVEAVKELMEQNKLDIQDIVKSFDPKFTAFKKDVENMINKSIQQLMESNKSIMISSLQQNKEAAQEVIERVNQEYAGYRNFVDAQLSTALKSIEEIRSDAYTSIHKFQTETITKFSELYNEVSRLIKHIKKFADI